MRFLIALAFCLPAAASTISYSLEQCGADCPSPYYAVPRPVGPTLPTMEQLRAYIGGPAGFYTLHATDWRQGWTVGDFYGPSGWDGSFLFDGQSLFCCKDDERWAQSVNDYGDTVSIMASATIVRLAERGELTFDRRVGIVRIDDNGVLYGNQFIMRPSEVLHTEQFATAGSVTENPEPSALLLLAGGAALIAMKRRRVSQ